MTKIEQAGADASAFFVATDRDDPPLLDYKVHPPQ